MNNFHIARNGSWKLRTLAVRLPSRRLGVNPLRAAISKREARITSLLDDSTSQKESRAGCDERQPVERGSTVRSS